MHKNDGRIVAGQRLSPATEFKTEQHWRSPQLFREREWLIDNYVRLKRSAGEIAKEFRVTDVAVLFWLKKHCIQRRSISEARAIKYWGLRGDANPMHGKTGASNHRYVDGSSPERQRLYVQGDGRQFLRDVLKRDNYRCLRCAAPKTTPKSLHVHHVKPWAGNEALRFDKANVVTLCRTCHSWIHSKANEQREYLA